MRKYENKKPSHLHRLKELASLISITMVDIYYLKIHHVTLLHKTRHVYTEFDIGLLSAVIYEHEESKKVHPHKATKTRAPQGQFITI